MAEVTIDALPAVAETNELDLIPLYDADGALTGRATIAQVVTTQHPSKVVWDDLRAPATSINPPGAVNDADVDLDGTLLFDPNSIEQIAVVFQMPHGWKEGSSIEPHVHWSKTTNVSGVVVWEYRYRVISVGEIPPAWSAWVSTDSQSADPGATQALTINGFPTLAMTGKTLSAIVSVQVRRNATAVTDTYGADARLWEVDIHYQIDGEGSDQEFVK